MELSSSLLFLRFFIILQISCVQSSGALSSDNATDSIITMIAQSTNASNSTDKIWSIPLPSIFHYYDLDSDGVLTLKELAKVTGTSRHDARMPFQAADINGDKQISSDEFNKAPWLFGDPLHLADIVQAESNAPSNQTRVNAPTRQRKLKLGKRKRLQKIRRRQRRKLRKKSTR